MKSLPAGRLSIALSVFCIVCVTVWTFAQIRSFGYVDYDDPAYITGNPYVNSGLDAQNIKWAFTFEESKGAPPHGGVGNLYHPITWMSHMIDVELFGIDSPGAQHVMNLTIHLVAGVLLFFIFLKLLGSHLVALMTALLFCIHPLHVESVAWLSERKDTLSALFAFASILCYQHYAESQRSRTKWSSIFLFVLALMSKPSVVVLPGILMLVDQYQKHQMNKWDLDFLKKQIFEKAGWIIPAIAAGLATVYFQQIGSHADFMKDVGFLDRIVDIPTRLCYYIYHVFNPTRLSFHYVAPPYDGKILAALCAILMTVLTVFIYKIRDRFPIGIFALLWFYIFMMPMSGIVHVGTSFIADRYSYLSIIGIFSCVSVAVIRLIPKYFAYSFLSVLVLTCALLSHQRTKVWKDSYSLFSSAIANQPRDPVAYLNLGAKYQVDGDFGKAAALYGKVIEMAPYNYMAHHNLANICITQGKFVIAEGCLLKALEGYENYHPSIKALAEIYRTETGLYDLDQSLLYTKRYNKVVKERDTQMLGVEIELLLELQKFDEAREVATRLQWHPNLTPQAKEFISSILNSKPSR